MKQKGNNSYESPAIQIICMAQEDVVRTSGQENLVEWDSANWGE